jgi:hypothetical protein
MIGMSVDAGFAPFGLIFAVIAALTVIAAWVILAGSRFVHGGIVERPERVPQLYGYTVCLITLIWGVVSFTSIVDHVLSLSAPDVRRGPDYGIEPSVTSFEAFRVTYDRSRRMMMPDPVNAKIDTVPEAELRKRFEAIRADRIRQSKVEGQRSIIVSTISLLIAAGLFLFHWRWLRRIAIAPTA